MDIDYKPVKRNKFDYWAWGVVFAWPLLSAILMACGVFK